MQRLLGVLGLATLALLVACSGGTGTGTTSCLLSGTLTSERVLDPGECSPYRVEGEYTIANTGRLVVRPGTTLEFAQDAGLRVTGYGVLQAVGTASEKIAFLGARPERGYWSGIVFDDAKSMDNALSYVEIAYAGGKAYWDSAAFESYRAAVALWDGTRLALSDVLIRESAGSGLFVDEDAELLRFERLRVTQNASFPLLIYAQDVPQLDAASDFTGNDAGMDYVRVADWNGIATATWKRLSVPYRVENELRVLNGELLTIEPGTTLVFEQDAGIFIEGHAGGLRAAGTATDPIYFTALDPRPGYWCGLVFSDSNHGDNLLQYAVVEYGGSGSCTQLYSSLKANVLVESAGNASSQYIRIYNSTIRQSAGYGVVVAQETNANDIAADNTFSNNALGDFYREP